jgi:hypothetical protein
MKMWEPKRPGTLWATPGLLRDCFTFTFFMTRAMNTDFSYKTLID